MLRTFSILSLAAGGVFTVFNQNDLFTTGQSSSTGLQAVSSQERSSTRGSAMSDGYLAEWISVGQRNVVELSRLAERRASDPQIKRHAAKMIADHQALIQELAPFSKGPNRSGAVEAGAPNERYSKDRPQTDRPQGDRAADELKLRESGELDHSALFEELGQQCLLSSRQELDSKHNAEFDRCYVGMMIMSHKLDRDALIVFQRHATLELAPVLAKAQSKIEQHLSATKELFTHLERKQLGANESEPDTNERKLDSGK